MRIMTYNILEGFRTKDGSLDDARIAAAKAVIGAVEPDVLVLNEALYARFHEGKAFDYAGVLGFPHAAAQLYDKSWGNAILSRHAIAAAHERNIYNRGALLARIHAPEGEIVVGTYHPHPSRYPDSKALDFARLVDIVGEGTPPFVLCGDFNAISPDDRTEEGYQRLKAGFAGLHGDETAGHASLRRFIESGQEIFPELAARGFHDLVPTTQRGATMPTRLVNPTGETGMRIDHLWGRGVSATAGGVVTGAAADAASDHYPVWVEVDPGRRA